MSDEKSDTVGGIVPDKEMRWKSESIRQLVDPTPEEREMFALVAKRMEEAHQRMVDALNEQFFADLASDYVKPTRRQKLKWKLQKIVGWFRCRIVGSVQCLIWGSCGFCEVDYDD